MSSTVAISDVRSSFGEDFASRLEGVSQGGEVALGDAVQALGAEDGAKFQQWVQQRGDSESPIGQAYFTSSTISRTSESKASDDARIGGKLVSNPYTPENYQQGLADIREHLSADLEAFAALAKSTNRKQIVSHVLTATGFGLAFAGLSFGILGAIPGAALSTGSGAWSGKMQRQLTEAADAIYDKALKYVAANNLPHSWAMPAQSEITTPLMNKSWNIARFWG